MKTKIDDILAKPHIGTIKYEPKDFKPDVDVRWCAGCGGYSILSPVQRIMPELGIPKEKIALFQVLVVPAAFRIIWMYMDFMEFTAALLP
jgi:hypothetical protein